MLLTKALGHWPFGSGDFLSVFTIYGHGGHLGHVTQMSRTNFRSPDRWRLHMKFGFDWPTILERSLKMVDKRTTDDEGRMTEHAYTVSSQ